MPRDIAPNFAYATNVVMMDSFGAPKLGLAIGDVVVSFWRPGNPATQTAAKADWAELGLGVYRFSFTPSEVGTTFGELPFIAEDQTGSPAINYPGLVHIQSGGPLARIATALITLRDGDFHALIFLQTNGQIDATGTEGRVTVFNEDGSTAIAVLTDAAPDAQGAFDVAVSPHGLSQNRNYVMLVEVDSPDGNVQSYQGFSTL